jgi:hypothetical protein
MSGYSNPIIGGGGGLVYPSIHSPGYVPGVSGWTIKKDGTVEFNSGIFRGTVTAGTFQGTNFVIDASGIHMKNPSGAVTAIFTNDGEFFYNDTGSATQGGLRVAIRSLAGLHDPVSAIGGPVGLTLYSGNQGAEVEVGEFTVNGFTVFAVGDLTSFAALSSAQLQLALAGVQQGFVSTTGEDAGGVQITGINAGNTGSAILKLIGGNNPYGKMGSGTPLLATDPATGLKESWHPFALLASTVAGTDINGTAYPPAYTLLADGNVALRGVVKAGAGGLAAGTAWGAVPAAYRPVTNIPVALVANGTLGTFAHVFARPNGNVVFDAALGAGVSMYIDSILLRQGT